MSNILIKASSRYPIRRKRIQAMVTRALEAANRFDDFEVEIFVIGDRKMREMKKKHLGKDETTDVLSFPLEDWNKASADHFPFPPDSFTRLGSIFVSYPQAQRQANLHKLLIDDEIDQLVEHGMLHLLGYHHR